MSSEQGLSFSSSSRESFLTARLPKAIADRLETIQHDLRMVVAGLSGRTPPSFVQRKPLARHLLATPAVSTRNLLATRTLRVARVTRETPDAVSLHLIDPTGRRISFTPGQFFTVLVTLPNGEVLRRAYSISNAPDDDGATSEARITIKRIVGGVASNHLNDTAAEGASFEVLGPSGNFTTTFDPAQRRHLVLFAGGSGITPLMSILRTVLVREPESRVSLVYGNRGSDDIIYRDELAELSKAYGERLAVRHVLTNPPEGFSGRTGLLDRTNAAAELEALPQGDEYFVCGPEPMMQAVRDALLAQGAAASAIREERYSSPARRVRPDAPSSPQQVVVRLGGVERKVVAKPGQTLLEAGLEASIPMPFSCSMGGCGACRVKLESGDVVSEEPNCLSEEERRDGFVLACVSRPSSACTVEIA
ncbi:MAG: ferredoxin--NADP reductase [Polyangiaceae bacterium]|nr:ferredoxin--NADP reductase [Polyangiaceae bacterium]